MTHVTKLIALHGVGSNGADLAGLMQHWQMQFPDLAAESPDAPFPFDGGGFGRQWFSIMGVTEQNRHGRVIDARAAFDDVIRDCLKRLNAAEDASDTAFLGFSQGTIMSLDAVADGRWAPAAVLGFSGRLTGPVRQMGGKTKILLTHGSGDPMIPCSDSEYAAQAFEKAGYQTALRVEPGLGHTISPRGAENALRFLMAM